MRLISIRGEQEGKLVTEQGTLWLTDLNPWNMVAKRVVVTVRTRAMRSSFRRISRQRELLLLESRDNGVDSLGSSSGLPMLSGSSLRGRYPR